MQKRPLIHIDLSDLLLEIISIVIAILLAIAVNNWQEQRRHIQHRNEALANIRQELKLNAAAVSAAAVQHYTIYRATLVLSNAGSHGDQLSFEQVRSMWGRVAPHGYDFVQPQHIAWDIAQSDGSLAYADYRTRSALAEAYDKQSSYETEEREGIKELLSSSPSGNANFYFSTADAEFVFSTVASADKALSKLYAQAIRSIDAQMR